MRQRGCLYALSAAVVLGVGVAAVLVYLGGKEDARTKALQDSVSVAARYEVKECGRAKPVAVTVTNGSARTLKTLHFALEVHAEGYSNDLTPNGYREWTKIVAPGSSALVCYDMPHIEKYAEPKGAKLVIRAEPHGATFY